MHEKKMSTGVVRIRMNTCTILGLIILPFLLFMLYVVLFSECTYLLRNNGFRNISPKFDNVKQNINKEKIASDGSSVSVDTYKELGLTDKDGPLELINKVQLKGDQKDNDLPFGKTISDKSPEEKLSKLPLFYSIVRIIILSDDSTSKSENGEYIERQEDFDEGTGNRNEDEGYGHEEIDSKQLPAFYPLFSFPREESKDEESSQLQSVTPSTSSDKSMEVEKSEKENESPENISNVISTDNKPEVKSETPEKPTESIPESQNDYSIDLLTIHKEDKNFHRMFYNFLDFSIPNTLICPKNGENLKLLIGIPSDVENFEQRKAIRNTWAKVAQVDGVSYAFIVGIGASDSLDNKLKHESDEFQDIIQADVLARNKYRDAYPVMFLKWIKTYCQHVKHVIKADDNVFLNLPQILKFINDAVIEDNTMYGDLITNEIPDRNEKSEDYVAKELYQKDIYPAFLERAGYLFPGKLAGYLFDKAAEMPYFPKENILITGILAEKLNVTREDASSYFVKYPEVETQEEKCEFLKYSIVYPVTPEQMRSLWDEIKSTDFKCFNFLQNLLETINTKNGNESVYDQQVKLFNLLNEDKIKPKKFDEQNLLE